METETRYDTEIWVPNTKKEFYEIPECNLPDLEARIDKLNRKAAKLQCEPVYLEECGYTEQEGEYGPVRVYKIKVHGPEPIIAGWKLIAKLEPAGAGNVIKRVSQGDDLAESWRTAPIWCDHCNLERARASSWIVRNVESGIEKQVGTSCLADFTGHGDPARFVAMAEWLSAIDQAANDAEEYDPDFTGKGGPLRLNLSHYLEWVSACVRAYGWVSRGKAREYGGPATADIAVTLWTKRPEYRKHDDPTPDERDEQIVKAALTWVREELPARGDLSDYEHNLITVCAEDSILGSWLGIAASLIAAHDRALNERARREKEAVSEWQGKIKERRNWGPLTVAGIWNTESLFGALWIYTFKDEAGNVYVWKTGQEYAWERGKQVAGKATVKEHGEYEGTKQTVLTRCAFEVLEPQEAEEAA